MGGVNVSPPPIRFPIIGPNGQATKEFTDFLYQLWDRTGGNDDNSDTILKMMLTGAGQPSDKQSSIDNNASVRQSLADLLSEKTESPENRKLLDAIQTLVLALQRSNKQEDALSPFLLPQRPCCDEGLPVGLMHAFPGHAGWLGELQKAMDESPQRIVLTQPGGSATEDGANTWARLVTYYAPSAKSTGTWIYTLMGGNSYAAPICRFMVRVRNNNGGTGIQTAYTSIEILDMFDEAGLDVLNGLYLVAPVDGVGVDIGLWMKKPLINQHFALFEQSHFLDSGVVATPNDNAAWQSTDPTSGAAIALAADWAGYPGPQSSTSFAASWAGTCTYEKQAGGLVVAGIVITTVGTITDGTTIFTMPAKYRPATGVTASVPYFDTAGSQGGRLTVDSTGAVKCYGLTGTPVAAPSGQFAYIARN